MSNVSATRSKLGREDIKWSELLSHFRSVQNRHEKSRRQTNGEVDVSPASDFYSVADKTSGASANTSANANLAKPAIRRRVTATGDRPPSRALSPLNPRARGSASIGTNALNGQGGGGQTVLAPTMTAGGPASPTFAQNVKQPGSKRTLSVSRKT